MNSVDLNISKSFVIKIADLYMPYLFGNGVISQKPWIIIEHSDSFVIKGTFHGNLSRRGGVAEIEISKKDGNKISNKVKCVVHE